MGQFCLMRDCAEPAGMRRTAVSLLRTPGEVGTANTSDIDREAAVPPLFRMFEEAVQLLFARPEGMRTGDKRGRFSEEQIAYATAFGSTPTCSWSMPVPDRRVRSDFSFIYWSKLGALRVTQVGGAKPQIAKLDCCPSRFVLDLMASYPPKFQIKPAPTVRWPLLRGTAR